MECDLFQAQRPIYLNNGLKTLTPAEIISFHALSPVTLSAGSTGGAGLWTGYGEPTTIIGSKVGDEYLDLATGDLYQLN